MEQLFLDFARENVTDEVAPHRLIVQRTADGRIHCILFPLENVSYTTDDTVQAEYVLKDSECVYRFIELVYERTRELTVEEHERTLNGFCRPNTVMFFRHEEFVLLSQAPESDTEPPPFNEHVTTLHREKWRLFGETVAVVLRLP
jgi:hypothetical protein